MERLPKEYERLLRDIAGHHLEVGYLEGRLGRLPFDDAYREATMLDDLEDLGFLKGSDRRIVRSRPEAVHGLAHVFEFPGEFSMRAKGMSYFREKRRSLLLWVGGVVFTAVLCGLFAVVFQVWLG